MDLQEAHALIKKHAEEVDDPFGVIAPCALIPRWGIVASREKDRELLDTFARHLREKNPEESRSETKQYLCHIKETFDYEINGWTRRQTQVAIIHTYSADERLVRTKVRVVSDDVIEQRVTLLMTGLTLRLGVTSIETELKAQENLMKRLSDDQQASYVLSGGFVENSNKSGCMYLLRKNYPILVFRKCDHRCICALCIHPLGYFSQAMTGVMAPSDEILAQLLMIRSDEHWLWRKSGQHPLTDSRSGL